MSLKIKFVPARPGKRDDDGRIATSSIAGDGTPLIYFAGFGATMEGNKAQAIAAFAEKESAPLIRFDYQGVGASPAKEAPRVLSTWIEDAVSVVDQLVPEQAILIGSSMGAWIALKVALARPEKVRSLILLACAADFTEARSESGRSDFPKDFIDDGANHLLLGGPIDIEKPVTLVHGLNDATIAWQNSLETAIKLTSHETELHIRRSGDHRLSNAADLEFMFSVIRKHMAV